MIVERIKREQYRELTEISAISFGSSKGYLENVEEELLRRSENPSSRTDHFWQEGFAAYDDNGKPMGQIKTFPYKIQFDGTVQSMAGVGDVCCLPVYRHCGAIRECFKKAFEYLKDNGVFASSLYPFSSSYYKNYGYGPAYRAAVWNIPFTAIKPYNYEGSFEIIGEDNFDDVKKVYTNAVKEYNYCVIREDLDWIRFKKIKMCEAQVYGYLYRGKDGEPSGYLYFKRGDGDNNNSMDTSVTFGKPTEFIFANTEALKAMLTFASTFKYNYDSIIIKLPDYLNIEQIFYDTTRVKKSVFMHSMLRVVDVETAFKNAAYNGSGLASIKIFDKYAPWNSGVWEVTFENGKCVSLNKSDDGSYDISCDISDFSSLIFGAYSMKDLRFMNDVEITGNEETLSKIFYEKPCFLADPF